MPTEFEMLVNFHRHINAIAEVVDRPFFINVGDCENLSERHQAWRGSWNHDREINLSRHIELAERIDHVDAVQIQMMINSIDILKTLDLYKHHPLAIRVFSTKTNHFQELLEAEQILKDRGYKVVLSENNIYATRKIVEHRDMTPFAPYSMTPPEYRQWGKAVENKDPEEIGRLIGIGFARQVQQMEALKK